jgi:transcriptional regulator with XRE-family HTH domain
MTLTEVGIEVARARLARGLSQSDLARASALSRQTISALERGAIPDIGVRKLIRILEALSSDTQFYAIRRQLPLRTPVGGWELGSLVAEGWLRGL